MQVSLVGLVVHRPKAFYSAVSCRNKSSKIEPDCKMFGRGYGRHRVEVGEFADSDLSERIKNLSCVSAASD
jgi:hypothetical protein